MKKIFWIIAPIILIVILIILVIALTNNSVGNPFKEFKLIIGIGFLVICGFTGIIYRKLYN
jgi:hypothetical protein